MDQNLQLQISYLWLTNLACSEYQISENWEYISFLGPNFSEMWGLKFILMSDVCYLAVILIFLMVTWWLLLVTYWLQLVIVCYLLACYLLVTDSYCSLLVVTACYCSVLFVPTFSMNSLICHITWQFLS